MNEEREQEQRGGLFLLLSKASTFRSALHVVKYGCGQFSIDRTHCKKMLEETEGGWEERESCSSCCCAHKFRIQSCFYLLWPPFFTFTVKFCATNLCNANLFFCFCFCFACDLFSQFFSCRSFFYTAIGIFLWNIFFA